jgi:menaquinone-dependent protoporphyrinogen IX oxidase
VRILILYESRRGFTLTVARAIRDELRDRGLLAETAPVRSVDRGTIAAADALIVGSWVKGAILFGVGPAHGVEEAIDALPELGGKPAAVFCTCDVAPRRTLDMLARWLRRRGAEVSVGQTFKRKKSLGTVSAFADTVLDAFARAQADA